MEQNSNRGQFFVIAAILVIAIAIVWLLLPPGLGLKTQIESMIGGLITLGTVGVGIIVWFLEALLLFIGSWILGFLHLIRRFDEWIAPKIVLEPWMRILLYVPMSVFVFLLWIFVAYTATWLPPIGQFFVGPWISGHVESGLVWWGVYGMISYLICNALDIS